MSGEMKPLSRNEVDKLMKKLSRETVRVKNEFVEKNNALAVGGERFQCYISCLPKTEEMRRIMGNDFEIITTVNGWVIKRLR